MDQFNFYLEFSLFSPIEHQTFSLSKGVTLGVVCSMIVHIDEVGFLKCQVCVGRIKSFAFYKSGNPD